MKLSNAMLLYAVTDRTWLGEKTLAEQVEQAIQGGVTMVQLREKNLGFEEFVQEAREIKKITDHYQIPFVINDDVEVAVASGADGIHVGQSDMEAGNVRARLGEGKIIGVSAQTVEQALLAERSGADYLGVGAVFSTSTKLDAQEVSYDTLKAICDAVKIPVVAIGGITAENLKELKGSGADGVAVVSAIFAKTDVAAAARALRQACEELVKE